MVQMETQTKKKQKKILPLSQPFFPTTTYLRFWMIGEIVMSTDELTLAALSTCDKMLS